jgi:hypothetical protein
MRLGSARRRPAFEVRKVHRRWRLRERRRRAARPASAWTRARRASVAGPRRRRGPRAAPGPMATRAREPGGPGVDRGPRAAGHERKASSGGGDGAVPEHRLARGELRGDELVDQHVRRIEDGAPRPKPRCPHSRQPVGKARGRHEHDREPRDDVATAPAVRRVILSEDERRRDRDEPASVVHQHRHPDPACTAAKKRRTVDRVARSRATQPRLEPSASRASATDREAS